MDNHTEGPKSDGLMGALRDLTDGVTDLVRYQTELIRVEARREASEAGRRGGRLLLFAGLALVGYLLLNTALVLLIGAFAGTLGMAVTALALAAVHLGVGGWGAARTVSGFEEQGERLEAKTRTLTTTEGWQIEGPDSATETSPQTEATARNASANREP